MFFAGLRFFEEVQDGVQAVNAPSEFSLCFDVVELKLGLLKALYQTRISYVPQISEQRYDVVYICRADARE